MKQYNLRIDLPKLPISVFEDVYPPSIDSFLLAEKIIDIVREGDKVLDIGTGCGILGILATLKGAMVVATDVHTASIECAQYNASLNNVQIDLRLGSLYNPIRKGQLFHIIIGNVPSLPTPPKQEYGEYVERIANAAWDGRKYLDPLIHEAPSYLKEGGLLLTQHSNFSDIEKTREKLIANRFHVSLEVYEFSAEKTPKERMEHIISNLPLNCHPFQKNGKWYQKNGIFIARLRTK